MSQSSPLQPPAVLAKASKKRTSNLAGLAAAAAFATGEEQDDTGGGGSASLSGASETRSSHAGRADEPLILAVCLPKGGAGKSTTTRNIADQLTALGHGVLIWDTDSQCNLTSTMIDNTSEV
jgi:Mrp family chromosome partitioning ATPase